MTTRCAETLSLELDAFIMRLLREAELPGPSINSVELAWRLGITVAQGASLQQRGEFVRLRSGLGRLRSGLGGCALGSSSTGSNLTTGLIKVRKELRPERVYWSVAHELGEALIEDLAAACELDAYDLSPPARETLCNAFAGRLLVPTPFLREAGADSDWNLALLKQVFPNASYELLARRSADLSPQALFTVCDQGKITWRQVGRSPGPRTWLPEERGPWWQAHSTGQSCDQKMRHQRVRVWAIHEPGWRREIVRTESIDLSGPGVWNDLPANTQADDNEQAWDSDSDFG